MNPLNPQDAQAQAIADYLAAGATSEDGRRLGFELEHIITCPAEGRRVFYRDDPSGAPGIETLLKRMAPAYDSQVWETHADGESHLIGLNRPCAAVTLEPGAQLEVSIGPVTTVGEINAVYRAFRADLDPLLAPAGYEALLQGYDPYDRAADVPLIPKKRYAHMDRYFTGSGWGGAGMMRASASTQVSIDFIDEANAVQKFRLANALAPLLYFVSDNTPVFETQLVGDKGVTAAGVPVPSRMARALLWDNVDPARSLVAPGTFERGYGFARYAASLLAAPSIFIDTAPAHASVTQTAYLGATPFSQAYPGTALDKDRIEHILSLFFFDVRFKTYIEIRVADAMPIEYALAYAALIKGVFYNVRALAELTEATVGVSAAQVAAAKEELRAHGYAAQVYGRSAASWLDSLIAYAQASLGPEERPYLEPLARLVAARTTLLDEYRAAHGSAAPAAHAGPAVPASPAAAEEAA
jgi:glutamate--cysteine ligase